jgi:integrase
MRASNREPQRKSREPVSRDVLERLLASCGGSRALDIRDRAILLVAFAAGAAAQRGCDAEALPNHGG